MNALVEATGISKRFGGLQALENVSFSIVPREIYGLIGPNGAGKTTLFNLLTGVYAPDAGSFRFDGRVLTGRAPTLSPPPASRAPSRTFASSPICPLSKT